MDACSYAGGHGQGPSSLAGQPPAHPAHSGRPRTCAPCPPVTRFRHGDGPDLAPAQIGRTATRARARERRGPSYEAAPRAGRRRSQAGRGVLTFVDASRQAGRVLASQARNGTGRDGESAAGRRRRARAGGAPGARSAAARYCARAELWRGNGRIYYRLSLAFHPNPPLSLSHPGAVIRSLITAFICTTRPRYALAPGCSLSLSSLLRVTG